MEVMKQLSFGNWIYDQREEVVHEAAITKNNINFGKAES